MTSSNYTPPVFVDNPTTVNSIYSNIANSNLHPITPAPVPVIQVANNATGYAKQWSVNGVLVPRRPAKRSVLFTDIGQSNGVGVNSDFNQVQINYYNQLGLSNLLPAMQFNSVLDGPSYNSTGHVNAWQFNRGLVSSDYPTTPKNQLYSAMHNGVLSTAPAVGW